MKTLRQTFKWSCDFLRSRSPLLKDFLHSAPMQSLDWFKIDAMQMSVPRADWSGAGPFWLVKSLRNENSRNENAKKGGLICFRFPSHLLNTQHCSRAKIVRASSLHYAPRVGDLRSLHFTSFLFSTSTSAMCSALT